MNCSPPGSFVHGIFQARILSGLFFPPLGDLPDPGIHPGSPSLQADSLPSQPPGKPPQCFSSSYFHILRAIQKRFLVISIRFTMRLTHTSLNVLLFATERKSIINAYSQETKLASTCLCFRKASTGWMNISSTCICLPCSP